MATERSIALALQWWTLELKLDAFIFALERRYAPDQPRVPAGNPDGGQWTLGGNRPGGYLPNVETIAQLADFTKHGVDQAINRSVGPAAILDAIKRPIKLRMKPDGSTQYVGRDATVVLNQFGWVITV